MGHARRWCSTTTWGAARWQQGLAAAIAAVIFWPQASVDPVVGLDPSWQAGLALARIHHLAWGPEIVFTYGPLGFLQNTAYYSFGQSLLATIYQPIVVAALFLGIAAALRQRHAPMTSLIGAFATTGIVAILHIGHGWGVPGLEYPELAVLAAFVWAAVPLLQQDPRRSTVFTTCIALGAAAGLQLLVKFNTGLAIVVIALAVSVLLDWRAVGRHCATVTAFAASTLIWWVLAGQQPGNLPAWLKSSAAMISGYSEAMAAPLPRLLVRHPRGRVEPCLDRGALRDVRPWPPGDPPQLRGARRPRDRDQRQEPRSDDLTHGISTLLLGLIVVAVAITPLSRTWRRAFVVVVAAIVFVELGADTRRHARTRGSRPRPHRGGSAGARASGRPPGHAGPARPRRPTHRTSQGTPACALRHPGPLHQNHRVGNGPH